jgi:5-methylcytosine-specific restriction endonuclease McrA
VPQNYVEAYKWATLAAAQSGADPQKLQAELSAKLSPKQIAEGQRLAALQITEQPSLLDAKAEAEQTRQAIRSEVRREVWRRDQGQCVRCGSRENLEYDHIIPVSKGGSNTARNIELLCETCNRSKSDSVQ